MRAWAAGGILGWPTSLWRDWLGWLPGFLRDIVFVIVGYLLLRLLFRRGLPAAGRIAGPVTLVLIWLVTWLTLLPEYLATRIAGHFSRTIPASFAYGELIAGLSETSESSTRRIAAAMIKARLPAGRLAFLSVVLVLVISNALAYHSHDRVPVEGWWHSVTAWIHSLGHNPVRHHVVIKHHHAVTRHHAKRRRRSVS